MTSSVFAVLPIPLLAQVSSSPLSRLAAPLQDATGLSPEVVADLLATAILVLVLWAARVLVLSLVRRNTDDVRTRYQWRKGVSYVTVAVGAFFLLQIWLGELSSLGTFLGLLSAGVAIALRDPLVNLAGWMFVVIRRPFSTGDRITVHGYTGDVIDQRIFQFTLLEVGTNIGAGQSTGRIIHVPNGWVFSDAVTNHTRAFNYVWNEIPVVVTFESDWREAKRLLSQVAEDHIEPLTNEAARTLRSAAQNYMIFYSKLTPTVYTDVLDHGVRLTLRYLSQPRRVRGGEQKLWEAILDAYAERDDIDFAYPTTRLYDNRREGKPGAGGPPAGASGNA